MSGGADLHTGAPAAGGRRIRTEDGTARASGRTGRPQRPTAPPPLSAWFPWADKRGRFSSYRAAAFVLVLLPGLWLLGRWAADDLGARPITEALHFVGDWTMWILLASLAFTPAKAVLAAPNAVVVRRMVGLAALSYAGAHLVLYAWSENWRLLHVAAEIVLRFYLLIGFVALVGLVVLGWTSTDAWIARLGRTWKRLHKVVYVLVALGVLHFLLQSKADVSRALLALGMAAWLLLWRLLPAGRDRGPVALVGLAVVSATITLGLEWAWYHFATKANAWRAVTGEFNLTFGPRPAGQVLALGLLVAAVAELRRLQLSRFAGAAWLRPTLVVGGIAIAGGTLWALNLTAPLLDRLSDWIGA